MRFCPAAALLLVIAAPAWAQSASSCDHYIPTGAPLPRDAVVSGNRVLYDMPTRLGHRSGKAVNGDTVSVLQECGKLVRIRTSDDQEGWINITGLPHELQLERDAVHRLPANNQDCELRFTVPSLVTKCETDLAQRQSRADELAHSTDLAGAAIQVFVAGRTLEIAPRDAARGQVDTTGAPALAFFQAKNEVFGRVGSDRRALFRGRWLVEGDRLCVPDLFNACGKLRRLPDGRTIWAVDGNREFIIAPREGDTDGLLSQVSKVFPYAKAPPVPEALVGLAHPAMGW